MKFISIILLIIMISTSGCISATVCSSGKRYEHLLSKDSSIEDINASLGEPVWSIEYDISIPINQTEYYRSYVEKTNNKPFIWGIDSTVEMEIAKYCYVYSREGPFWDDQRGVGCAMLGGLTLGIGDIIILPYAISYRLGLSDLIYSITFWYDKNKKYVGYYKGDIRNIESHWWIEPN